MMRSVLVALAALSFMLPAFATAPFPGSTVYVKPIATEANPAPDISDKVIRLPKNAGIVKHVQATNAVKGVTSYLVEGHEFWSLCSPRGRAFACTPLVLAATMRDIEIRAYMANDSTPMFAYNVSPKTTRTAAELALSMDYFQTRLNKRVAAYNMVNPNTDPTPPRGSKPRSGVKSLTIHAEGGISCTFDDMGGVDCFGGDSGGSPDSREAATGGGTDTWEYDWQPDEQYDTPVVVVVGEAPPSPSPPPSYPGGSGTDRGDRDPCIAADGGNLCQQVIIKASLPVAPQGCVFTPLGIACTNTPPVAIDPHAPPLPRETPFFPQGACNLINALCSAGQTPEDNERVEPKGDDYAADIEACFDMLEVEEIACYADKAAGAKKSQTSACLARARSRYASCLTTARRKHGIGSGI